MIEVCRPDGPDHRFCGRTSSCSGNATAPGGFRCTPGRPRPSPLACRLDAGEMPRPKAYQLAVDLLAAAGVDARPSDVVNLAVLSGAPIRVDAAILDDPVVDSPSRVGAVPGATGGPDRRGAPAQG